MLLLPVRRAVQGTIRREDFLRRLLIVIVGHQAEALQESNGSWGRLNHRPYPSMVDYSIATYLALGPTGRAALQGRPL